MAELKFCEEMWGHPLELELSQQGLHWQCSEVLSRPGQGIKDAGNWKR